MRFLNDTDYDVLIRDEIIQLITDLDGTPANNTKILQAEDMAIAQIKNYLSGRYDIDKIFSPTPADERNQHIIMITIDMALYHLYTALSPDKIPEHRSNRYQDALNWLEKVATGKIFADLPKLTDDKGNEKYPFIIKSEHPKENNRW